MTRPPIGTRGVSGGGKAGRGAGSGEGSRRAGASNTSSKKYTGVTLKSNGRWRAQCRIGGKQTSLGYFGNEEEAARAWDRTRLWSCKAGRRAKKEVEKLNFPLSEYSDDEVTALQGCTQEEIIKKLQRTEERAANQASKYTGVYLYKRNGRWEAQCKIGGKLTSLGQFGSEEEAARAWDRMRLWSCKVSGKKKEEVKLNFPLSDYSATEVNILKGLSYEGVIQRLRRTGQETRGASSSQPDNNRRGTLRTRTKRSCADDYDSELGSDADADDFEDEGDVEEEEEEEEEEEDDEEEAGTAPGQPQEDIAARGSTSLGTWALKRSRSKQTPPPLAKAESPTLPGLECVVVMSGNHLECGICFEAFDDADATGSAARHMFWPCQHARQCGDCASHVWKTPPKRRPCPWCAAKIDSRPRPLKPYV